jgi:pyruvate kinase
VEFIALSFVRKAADVRALRRIVDRKRPEYALSRKIEKPEATRRIGDIAPHDGIMVARGDLGVETTPFEVAIMQKTLVEKTARAGKMVIVATQMLESM